MPMGRAHHEEARRAMDERSTEVDPEGRQASSGSPTTLVADMFVKRLTQLALMGTNGADASVTKFEW